MKAFLDSSVLVASFYGDDNRHESSSGLLRRQNKRTACTAAHCLAEVYATLTGMPGKYRAAPEEALLFLDELRERLALVALDPKEFMEVLQQAALANITGGGIYDAIIGRCATKAKAEAIYTWNTKHFMRLGEDVAGRVSTPHRPFVKD